MKKENKQKYVALFGKDSKVPFAEQFKVFEKVHELGGLTFKVEKHKEGWTAQCNEVPGIVAGSTNPKPTAKEIESEIREAILSAFDVEDVKSKGDVVRSNLVKYSIKQTTGAGV